MTAKRNKDPADARHDLSNDFVRMLSDDWQENGKATIERLRADLPDKYCELVAKVVPKEMLIASDRTTTESNQPQDSEAIAAKLLWDIGLVEPDDDAKQRALMAYDALVAELELIKRDALQ